MLNSLRISNFRAFENLEIDRLGKVNLIVGRNNVGKTSLLEAVHLYSSDDVLDAVIRLLRRRQEYSIEKGGHVLLYNSLFYQDGKKSSKIEIGEINGESPLVIRRMWRWTEKTTDFEGEAQNNTPRIRLRRQFSEEPPDELGLDPDELGLEGIEAINEVLTAQRGTSSIQSAVMGSDRSPGSIRRRYEGLTDSLFLPSSGFQDDYVDAAKLWDRVVVADKEHAVLDALRVVEPSLERIVMVQGRRSERLAIVKLHQQKNMPLRSLGDGINKLFELALGLVNAGEDRAFLVDEIDSGLHFSTLTDVWRLVFRTAVELRVQVFATTHSWDCIEAFQKAAEENQSEGFLIRLDRINDVIKAEAFSEEDLNIITRESIEVR